MERMMIKRFNRGLKTIRLGSSIVRNSQRYNISRCHRAIGQARRSFHARRILCAFLLLQGR